MELSRPDPNQITEPSIWAKMPPRARKVILGISGTGCFGFVLWGLNQFLSLRGVIHVLASRIVLAATVAVAILGLFFFTRLLAKRKSLSFCIGAAIVMLLGVLLDWWAPKPKEHILIAQASLFLDCDMIRFPITIPAGSTAHVLRLQSDSWNFNVLLLIDISAPEDRIRTWPSNEEAEPVPYSIGQRLIPESLQMKCSVREYGSKAVDKVLIPLTPSNGHKTPPLIPIDPLTENGSFQRFAFYIINACYTSPNVVQDNGPLFLVTFGKTARVHVIGESRSSDIPITVAIRNNLSSVLDGGGLLMPANRHWKDLPPC